MSENEGGYWRGLVTGVLVGAGAALLLAPRKGEELREEIAEGASTLKERAGGWSGEVAGTIADKAHELRVRSEGAIDSARAAINAKLGDVDDDDETETDDDALDGTLDDAEEAARELKAAADEAVQDARNQSKDDA